MKSIILYFFLAFSAPMLLAQETQTVETQTVEAQDVKTQDVEAQKAIDVPDPGTFPKNEGNLIVWVSQIGKWLVDLIGYLTSLILVLEIMIRKIPSKNNWSIIATILGFLDKSKGILAPIFRNSRSGGGYFVTKTHVEE